MCVPRSTFICKLLESYNRLVLAEVFVFVSSSLTKLMNIGLVLFFDLPHFLSLFRMAVVSLITRS